MRPYLKKKKKIHHENRAGGVQVPVPQKIKQKSFFFFFVTVHTYIPTTQEVEAGEHKFKASPVDIVSPCLKKCQKILSNVSLCLRCTFC
jgi:hypothetical protein